VIITIIIIIIILANFFIDKILGDQGRINTKGLLNLKVNKPSGCQQMEQVY